MLYTKANHCYNNLAFLLYSVPGPLCDSDDFLGRFLLHVEEYESHNTQRL